MSIVGGLDVHRRQITFDWVDRATGQAQRGQITPATREGLGRWLAQLPDHPGAFAVEACTGWRFVVEELQAVGWQACLAEPAETRPCGAPSDGPRPTDAQLLRELLDKAACRRRGSHRRICRVLRVLVRLGKTLVDQRTAFKQRLHAVLFHHGLPCPDHALLTQATRGWLEQLALPQASRLQVTTALRQIDQLDLELDPLERWLRAPARPAPAATAQPPAASKDCVAAHTRSPIRHLVAGSARWRVRAPRKDGRRHAHPPMPSSRGGDLVP